MNTGCKQLGRLLIPVRLSPPLPTYKSSLCFTQHQLHLGHLLVPAVRATFARGQVKELAHIGRVVRLNDGVEWVAH